MQIYIEGFVTRPAFAETPEPLDVPDLIGGSEPLNLGFAFLLAPLRQPAVCKEQKIYTIKFSLQSVNGLSHCERIKPGFDFFVPTSERPSKVALDLIHRGIDVGGIHGLNFSARAEIKGHKEIEPRVFLWYAVTIYFER